MRETNFFNELYNFYSNIDFKTQDTDLITIDKNITYYLADKRKEFISVSNKNIIDVDIKSAFPTIVNNMFDQNSEFIIKLNNLKKKKEKNIFIATTLSKTQYLKRINMICKMIIYGLIEENCSDFLLLELKKDGILIQCDNENLEKINKAINGEEYLKNSLTEYILSKNFKFHITKYKSYCRCNKTSFFNDNELKIKGKYKYIPKKLYEILNHFQQGFEIDFYKLTEIYSEDFFNVIKLNHISEYLNDYYICSNGKIIDSNNTYVKFNYHTKINPRLYLRNFVFPILASVRII